MKINVIEIPGKRSFKCNFRHPVLGKAVSTGLGIDRLKAESDCREAVEIFSSPILLADPESPRLMAYSTTAYEIVFRRAPSWADKIRENESVPALIEDDDVARLATRIASLVRRPDLLHDISEIIASLESRRYRELFEKFTQFENEVKVLRGRAVDAERELAQLRRGRNEGVDVSIGEACKIWQAEYKTNHAHKTWQDAQRCVDLFIESLERKGKFPLADVRAAMIDKWRAELVMIDLDKDGNEIAIALSPTTKKRYLANVRTFFSWAQGRYDLVENPGKRVSRAAGELRHAEDIRALSRLEDINEVLKRLRNEPYWLPLVSMFIFSGARYGELVRMKMQDIHLDEGHVRIFSLKTGRGRSVPIERSKLFPALKDYLKFRSEPAAREDMKRDWDTDILFPSIQGVNEHMPRSKTPPGRWVDVVFGTAWKAKREELFDSKCHYLDFGPDEWRHTFGTILAHCKWSALQISEAMGNSEEIVKRYYVVPGSGGREWPFKY